MTTVQMKRNPFARETQIRKVDGRGECIWCGQTKRLFRYGIETDSGRKYWDGKAFCCAACRRDYYGFAA